MMNKLYRNVNTVTLMMLLSDAQHNTICVHGDARSCA